MLEPSAPMPLQLSTYISECSDEHSPTGHTLTQGMNFTPKGRKSFLLMTTYFVGAYRKLVIYVMELIALNYTQPSKQWQLV
jgi:hypothetical protein